ncbi:SDR family NAD(P)-dependent oxidoreductase [Paenibacillus chitinolyticus]|uniref:SDR family NAD(P)-dependent oxidoreductase n=1 Tax=Paenibacillus chitinolyticus TaxID=79263 RepID=UPI003660D5CF
MDTKQQNKVALITGAKSGIGFELTKRLLSEGMQVIALIRSDFPNNDSLVRESLKNNHLRVYKADLSDFKSLKAALNEIKSSEERIDVIFNNAGIMPEKINYSKQGRELQFEVHAVVPYIIFVELRELLLKGGMKTIVNTSSNALLMVKRFELEILEKPAQFKKLMGGYAASKLALSLWTQAASQTASAEGIEIRSVCPGPNKTPMSGSSGMPLYMIPIRNLFFSPPGKGAARLYEAAFGVNRGKTGVFINKGKITPVKFMQESRNVLEKVDSIYKLEFLST